MATRWGASLALAVAVSACGARSRLDPGDAMRAAGSAPPASSGAGGAAPTASGGPAGPTGAGGATHSGPCLAAPAKAIIGPVATTVLVPEPVEAERRVPVAAMG